VEFNSFFVFTFKFLLSLYHCPVVYLDIVNQAGLVSAQGRAVAGPETARLKILASANIQTDIWTRHSNTFNPRRRLSHPPQTPPMGS
jgi:hypothetical protein